jgi:predicted acylesterase/phospholipase RssA
MSKCALVLSGGGIKAFVFHMGVVRALEETIGEWNCTAAREGK